MGPGIIVTPQTMLDYLNEVDRYIRAIDRAVAPQTPKLSGVTLAAWWDFLAQWKAFYEAHKGGWNVSGGVADTTERYETDATKWRTFFVERGFSLEAVVFDPAKKPGGVSLPTFGETTSLLWAGAAVLGVLMLWRGTRAR